jgi:RNA polymerase sigma-70 factor (ECF subfamily)
LQNPIFRFCWSQLSDAELAKDAAQETAIRILAGLERFRGSSRVKTWALGIALNVCREMRRKMVASSGSSDVGSIPSQECGPDERLCQQERDSQLHALLKCLTGRQREMVALRYFEDLSIEETAQAMNVAPGTVKATIWQALRSMRRNAEQGNGKVTPND